jgi:hypothetical protein
MGMDSLIWYAFRISLKLTKTSPLLSGVKGYSDKKLFLFFAGILLIEAICQWKIYVLLWENSHVMAGLMETKWFYISNNRYGMFATQIIPVIGAQIGLTNDALIGLQVLNYALLPIGLMGIVLFKLKDVRHMILMFFFSVCGGVYIHFAKEYSLLPTLLYCLLLSSFIEFKADQWARKSYVLLGLLTAIIIFSHSLSLFFLGILIVAQWRQLPRKVIVVCIGAIGMGLVLSILNSDYLRGNVGSIETEVNGYGIVVTLRALKHLAFYFSSFFLLFITVYAVVTKKSNRYVWLAWLAALPMLFIALRYTMSVAGTPYAFDVSFLINTRTEVTLFFIVTGLIYIHLIQVEWTRKFTIFIIVLSVIRFGWINLLSSELNERIDKKEMLFDKLTTYYPDKHIFIVSRSCPDIPIGYEHDDFKHESAVMSWYKKRLAIIYLSDHLMIYDQDGRPFFVNTANTEVDLDNSETFVFPFDPLLNFTQWHLKNTDVQLIDCIYK